MPDAYDEFSMFRDNCTDAGLEWPGPPTVQRLTVTLGSGLRLSALRWGTDPPEIVLLHGGAQNAHTWDTVALALGRPLLAIDLPGHGHSDWRPEQDYWPASMADDVAVAVEQLAPDAALVAGMSMGGLTALCLASRHPHLVRRLALLDVTPGVDHAKAEPIVTFVNGPEEFASFDEILARTIEHNPSRSESSLRRGVLHNAREQPDGTWSWRYDPMRDWKSAAGPDGEPLTPDFASMWDNVDELSVPVSLYLGGAWSVVDDEDVAEFRRRCPSAEVITVDGAGHSIQGDKPLELAELLRGLLA
ncbi:MAG: alpha/beta hydrolase [Acidimicrobiia bacterium]|nr:alpha/beta hydrolase [Acidimicrobiia bacterium]MDH5236150.1 alpha/beta hydrolase [Acidimicrobiia bacterium]